jgi:hypothetical protein
MSTTINVNTASAASVERCIKAFHQTDRILSKGARGLDILYEAETGTPRGSKVLEASERLMPIQQMFSRAVPHRILETLETHQRALKALEQKTEQVAADTTGLVDETYIEKHLQLFLHLQASALFILSPYVSIRSHALTQPQPSAPMDTQFGLKKM